MKKSLFKGVLLGALLVLFLAPGAMAFNITIYQNSYSSGSGGEFELVASGSVPMVFTNYYASSTKNIVKQGSFESFCLEHNEYFSPGSTYIAALSDRAMNGGVGSAGDPISVGTAWLYDQFATGVLSGYFTASDRKAEAGKLQNAIWYLEGEGGANNGYVALAQTSLGNITLAAAMADNNGQFSVKVLNLTDAGGGLHQDQLVRVPEPATMLLLGFGLVGLTLVGGRRFVK